MARRRYGLRYGRRRRRSAYGYANRALSARRRRGRVGGLSRIYRNRSLVSSSGSGLIWKTCDRIDAAAFGVSNTATPTNTTNPVGLNFIAEGTSFSQRVGRTICMRSLTIHINLYQYTANTATDPIVRFVLFYDAQTNGSLPLYTDVIASYDSAVSASNGVNDFPNPNNRDRFKILFDKTIECPYSNVVPGGGTAVRVDAQPNVAEAQKWYIKKRINLKGLETKFGGAAAAIGSIQTGGLFLFCVTNNNDNIYFARVGARLVYTN